MGRRVEKSQRQRQRKPSSSLPYVSRRHLLTPGERRFHHQGLYPAVSQRYVISLKVRLADVITVDDWESPAGRKISQKHIDFVLVTPRTTRIVAVVELNDASHEEADRTQRDEFLTQALQAAGIPLITFPIYRTYDPRRIRQRIFAAIASAPVRPWGSSS